MRAGDCAVLRRSVPHAWRAASETARLLVIVVPGAFGDFWFEVGEPGEEDTGDGPDAPPDSLPALLDERGVLVTGASGR